MFLIHSKADLESDLPVGYTLLLYVPSRVDDLEPSHIVNGFGRLSDGVLDRFFHTDLRGSSQLD